MALKSAPVQAFFMALVLLLLFGGPAISGAWTKDKGRGEVIVTGLYAEAMEAFDGEGDAVSVPAFRKTEIFARAEYGLTDWLTVIGRTEMRTSAFDAPFAFDEARFGLTGVGARLLLWQGDGAVVSAEASGRIATGGQGRNDPDGEIDLRLLAGQGFELGGLPAFVDLQGAYRFRVDAPSDEFAADITLGIRPRPQLLLLAQSFSRLPVAALGGKARAAPSEHKLAFGAVYDVTKSLSLQLGGIATLAGRNAVRDQAIVAAVWLHF